MTDYQGLVQEFHETFGHPVAPSPMLVAKELGDLRFDLIAEEAEEYGEGLDEDDIVKIADALGDILYVTFGAAVVHGIDLGPIFEEIHRSNMSKLGEDGEPIYREDGKVLKGPNYFTPDIEAVLHDQLQSA